jgi:hypothetical protein
MVDIFSNSNPYGGDDNQDNTQDNNTPPPFQDPTQNQPQPTNPTQPTQNQPQNLPPQITGVQMRNAINSFAKQGAPQSTRQAFADNYVMDSQGNFTLKGYTPPQTQTQPTQNGQPMTAPEDMSLTGFAGNVLKSGANLVGGAFNAINHPLNTVMGIEKIGSGAILDAAQKLGVPLQNNQQAQQAIQSFQNIVNFYGQRYGGSNPEEIIQHIANTAYNDPVGFLLDMSVVAGGVGTVAEGVKGAAVAGQLGDLTAEESAQVPELARAGAMGGIAQGAQGVSDFANAVNPINVGSKLANGAMNYTKSVLPSWVPGSTKDLGEGGGLTVEGAPANTPQEQSIVDSVTPRNVDELSQKAIDQGIKDGWISPQGTIKAGKVEVPTQVEDAAIANADVLDPKSNYTENYQNVIGAKQTLMQETNDLTEGETYSGVALKTNIESELAKTTPPSNMTQEAWDDYATKIINNIDEQAGGDTADLREYLVKKIQDNPKAFDADIPDPASRRAFTRAVINGMDNTVSGSLSDATDRAAYEANVAKMKQLKTLEVWLKPLAGNSVGQGELFNAIDANPVAKGLIKTAKRAIPGVATGMGVAEGLK